MEDRVARSSIMILCVLLLLAFGVSCASLYTATEAAARFGAIRTEVEQLKGRPTCEACPHCKPRRTGATGAVGAVLLPSDIDSPSH